MKKLRKKRYYYLRNIRRERDYQIGRLQFANRPYSFPTATRPNGKKKALTTSKFMKRNNFK